MCIAIIKKSGVELPSEETLYYCFYNNPHGAGFTVNRNGYNYIKKGFMTFEDFMNALEKENIKEDEAALLHFRVASVGTINKGNCHPFPATQNFSEMRNVRMKTDRDVVVHNGTFFNFMGEHNGDYSDTMRFVNMIAPLLVAKQDMTKKQVKAFNELVENVVDNNYSRVAIMNRYGRINYFGDWILEKETGILYSNKSYEKITPRFSVVQLEFDFK